MDEVTRLHYLMPSLEAHIESSEELEAHEQIAAAIEAGDQRGASRAMRDHLRATDRTLVEVFGVPAASHIPRLRAHPVGCHQRVLLSLDFASSLIYF